ncbi:helix-turn-helix domain-containing protein, partial [Fusobacterium necrophorum]
LEDKVYYFVSRNLVLQELPMFFEKADTVYRTLKVLAEKGIIEYIKYKNMDLIRLTEKGKTWNFIKNNSEKNPTLEENSEKFPSE